MPIPDSSPSETHQPVNRPARTPSAMSPLPPRHGLNSAWVRTPDRDPANEAPWGGMRDWLHEKVGEFIDVDVFLRGERFVYATGAPVTHQDPYRANTFIWFHRDLPDETPVPGDMPIVFRDDRIVVVDKPPFLSSIPRGKHILQSAVARLRTSLKIADLTPVHRLDRVTSGLLMFTTERRWRGPYQVAFQQQQVDKKYLAMARYDSNLDFPVTVRNHLVKQHGELRVRVIDGAPANTHSTIEALRPIPDSPYGLYRLTPHTGKTHQLRQHMSSLGLPIVGDPLYPRAQPVAIDDFSEPLQLLAAELSFVDPIDGSTRHFVSRRSLPIPGHFTDQAPHES